MIQMQKNDLKFRSQVTDLKRRKKFIRRELQSIVLKAVLSLNLVSDLSSSIDKASKTVKKTVCDSYRKPLSKLPEVLLQDFKQNSFTRVRNRCVLSGRSSTLKRFRLSRICFREQAGSGKLFGVSKRLQK
jgi:ribosomal protein S14